MSILTANNVSADYLLSVIEYLGLVSRSFYVDMRFVLMRMYQMIRCLHPQIVTRILSNPTQGNYETPSTLDYYDGD